MKNLIDYYDMYFRPERFRLNCKLNTLRQAETSLNDKINHLVTIGEWAEVKRKFDVLELTRSEITSVLVQLKPKKFMSQIEVINPQIVK